MPTVFDGMPLAITTMVLSPGSVPSNIVELSAYRGLVSRGHGHGAVVLSAGKELMSSLIVGDQHQWVVGGGLAHHRRS